MQGAGFIVICTANPLPLYGGGYHEHPTVESARDEARRLAEGNPGKTFVVYEAVLLAKLRDPVEVIDLREPQEDGPPF